MEIRNVSNGNVERPRSDRPNEGLEFPKVPHDPLADLAESIGQSRLAKLQPPTASTNSVADVARELRQKDEDRLEVSKASEALAAEEDSELVTRRRARVEAIREALAEGKLVTPERVEAAARKLLGN